MCVCVRLCSLAHDAKQETDDPGSLKKSSIKPEPAASEEEPAEPKFCKTTDEEEKEDVDTKPTLGKNVLLWSV